MRAHNALQYLHQQPTRKRQIISYNCYLGPMIHDASHLYSLQRCFTIHLPPLRILSGAVPGVQRLPGPVHASRAQGLFKGIAHGLQHSWHRY